MTVTQVPLVEDSPGGVRLTQEALRDANPSVHLHVACDGVEAMAYLRREGCDRQSPRPDVIPLDLNMPGRDGRQVLARSKMDASLKTIPTVILTTSEAQEDIVKSYRLRANCYLGKPVHLDDFEALLKSINDFWMIEASCHRACPARERKSRGSAGMRLKASRAWEETEKAKG